jgi:hypothetical protein
MKFKDLTEADKEYAYGIYTNKDLSWDDRMLKLVRSEEHTSELQSLDVS